jgi:hypothetical protein
MNIKEPKIEVITETGCWIWLLCLDRYGYGTICVDNLNRLAHRYYYEKHKGPIPEGMQLDHTCSVRCCVNPDHLEPVTAKENTARTIRRGRHSNGHQQELCKAGHAFAPDNTIRHKDGRRECRICRNARKRLQHSQRVR